MTGLRKNVASQVVTFCLVNATTGAALTGATVTTKVALDGTQSAGAGTVTELGTGQYRYVPTQGETNGASVGFCFTATNAVPVNLHCFTTANDPATVLPTAAGVAFAVLEELIANHTESPGSLAQLIIDISSLASQIDAKTINLPADPAGVSDVDTVLTQATLARKLLKNRTETDPATGIMTVYDDDGTTPLYTANIYTDVAGATPYDGTAGVNRRDALLA